MDLKELDSFKMSDAIAFHNNLNPNLFRGNHLQSEVADQLKVIAQDFLQELGIKDLDVKDITISGSNAAYSYTPNSDLDLHILVDLSQYPDDEIYQELFHAKKTIYNDSHNIKVHGIPVELYVQDASEPVISLGEYSVLKDKWIRIPTKRRSNFDQTATKKKYEKLLKLAEYALQSKKLSKVKQVLETIKRYRQAGLDKGGEFGPENLAYKALRSQGIITKLYDLRDKLHSKHLSLNGMYSNPVDEDYDPNGPPPGPEFKPTMPAGTVRVDVSDVYDWYKLGQHISDLDHTDPKMFGKGPPSTIMAFGSEPEEHKYINRLKNLGLTTTDIDPLDKNQPPGMPRQTVDPTYNVNEEEIDESFGTGPYQVGDVLFDIRRHAIDRLEQRNVPITTAKEMLRRISTMKDKLRKMPPHAAFWVYDESLGISMGMRVLDSGKVQWATTIIGKPFGRIDNPIIDLTESTQEIHNYSKLDKILAKLCNMLIKGQESDKDYGMVAAAVIDPDNNIVAGLNSPGTDNKRVHAERVAIEKYEKKYGPVPEGSIVVTTLSPCNESDDETAANRVGESCTDYLNDKGIDKVYCGYIDPTQDNDQRQFNIMETGNQDIRKECKKFADTFLKQEINEASGYIPSEKEKNDPRFKTALTVDVHPDSIKKNAKAFAWLTNRAGVPPTAKANGKIS